MIKNSSNSLFSFYKWGYGGKVCTGEVYAKSKQEAIQMAVVNKISFDSVVESKI